MKLNNILQKGKASISFEIFPPKRDTELAAIDDTLEVLCGLKPDYISVTFGAGGSMANSKTLEIAKKIKQKGIEPIVHLTCLNYTKSEIDGVISELNEAGVDNVLALRGDKNPNITQKFEFMHASDMISYLKERSDLYICGACYPEKHPEAPDKVTDMINLKKKVDAGADALISQLFFDNETYFRFLENTRMAGIEVPIHAGIMPVINKAQIERMTSLCGATLPDKFVRIMNRYENDKEALLDAGMVYAINQIVDLLANGVDGIHVYTMNNVKIAERICKEIKNLW